MASALLHEKFVVFLLIYGLTNDYRARAEDEYRLWLRYDLITDAKVIVCCPGRNFVTLKINTDAGIYGLGDATLNGREKAVATYLEAYCIPALIGKDPRNIEDIWHYFSKGVYWKRGAVTMSALSAIDMALWDIKAKSLNTPLYNLLGGKSRERVLVYAHVTGKNLEQTIEDIGKKVESGFLAVRVQSGVPGLGQNYGVPKDDKPYEPVQKGLPQEEIWDTAKYLNFVPRMFAKVRTVFGDELHLLHDVHHRCTPIEAARLAGELEPFHLFFSEAIEAIYDHPTSAVTTSYSGIYIGRERRRGFERALKDRNIPYAVDQCRADERKNRGPHAFSH